MQHSEFIRRVGNRMIEYNVEPTREDFADWLKESSEVSTEGRRVEIQAFYNQGMPQWDIVSKLTDTEELSWWQYINYLIDERTDW